jgi:hypothetical protein
VRWWVCVPAEFSELMSGSHMWSLSGCRVIHRQTHSLGVWVWGLLLTEHLCEKHSIIEKHNEVSCPTPLKKSACCLWQIRISPDLSVENGQLVIKSPCVLCDSSLVPVSPVISGTGRESQTCLLWASENNRDWSLSTSLPYNHPLVLHLAQNSFPAATVWMNEWMSEWVSHSVTPFL